MFQGTQPQGAFSVWTFTPGKRVGSTPTTVWSAMPMRGVACATVCSRKPTCVCRWNGRSRRGVTVRGRVSLPRLMDRAGLRAPCASRTAHRCPGLDGGGRDLGGPSGRTDERGLRGFAPVERACVTRRSAWNGRSRSWECCRSTRAGGPHQWRSHASASQRQPSTLPASRCGNASLFEARGR